MIPRQLNFVKFFKSNVRKCLCEEVDCSAMTFDGACFHSSSICAMFTATLKPFKPQRLCTVSYILYIKIRDMSMSQSCKILLEAFFQVLCSSHSAQGLSRSNQAESRDCSVHLDLLFHAATSQFSYFGH